MADPLVCPICESRLGPHCQNDACSWARCSHCGYVGKPEENKWVPPIGKKDDDRR